MTFRHKYFINIKLLLTIHWLLVDTSVDKTLMTFGAEDTTKFYTVVITMDPLPL